ncbi:MAG: xanthine dehydrogenase family protein molybdopterin-binding subunit, partial [Alphaproteobacteria bacterium]
WVDTIACLGAYQTHRGAAIPGYFYVSSLPGPYKLGALWCRVRGAYTNTPPVHAYRGAGGPEAVFLMERLIDTGARALGLDPCQVRRRNLIGREEFPYRSAADVVYDSGDPPGLLDRLAALARYDELRAEQRRLRGQGVLMGIGLSGLIESFGAPSCVVGAIFRHTSGWDRAVVRVHPTGKVTVLSGAHSHGQGHATTFAQIAADRLGCAIDDVEVVEGDTDRVPFGHGTFASRSTVTTGMAIVRAADRIRETCARIAAHMLECSEEDIERRHGSFAIRGTDRRVDFGEVVAAAHRADSLPDGVAPGLEESVTFDPSHATTAIAMHLAVVLVDPDTGRVMLRDYAAVDDSGRIINPLIVEGQVHGGLAQGIGQALMEHVAYDHSTGQVLAASFMDYAMPRADDLPSFLTALQETPTPHNALGAKGAGESGTAGAPGAVANAVVDALSHLGVRHIDMPLSPFRVWRAIRGVPPSDRPGVDNRAGRTI